MSSKSEIYHNLIVGREKELMDGGSASEGYSAAYSFLDSAFSEEESFEEWVIDLLSLTGVDREDGVEKGRIYLNDDFFLTKSVWRSYDFDDSDLEKGDTRVLKEYYESETGRTDFADDTTKYNMMDFLSVVSTAFDKNSDKVENYDESNSPNRYSFEISKEDIHLIYDCLDEVFFPDSDQVEEETGFNIDEMADQEILNIHVENFPYADNKYVSEQLDIDSDEVSEKRKELIKKWKNYSNKN